MDIMAVLDSPIVVEVGLDVFKFVSGKHSFELDTCLHLTDIDKRVIQVSRVGQRNSPDNPGVQVELFQAGDGLPKALSRYFLLQHFMNYGIKVLQRKKHSIFRPAVYYQNSSCLDEALMGYQQIILERAAIEGGARKVRFEEG